MNITLLCNAGLTLEYEGQMLLVDLPNIASEPFVALSDRHWKMLCERTDNICGFFFTHDHPDHFDKERLNTYLVTCPTTPVFLPEKNTKDGNIEMGPFTIHYYNIEHAPIPMAPPHVSAVIEAGEHSVYVSADATLDCNLHKEILGSRIVEAAFWNSMYLSRTQTRALMASVSVKNYIYHMPLKSECDGIWKKAMKNFERYREELENVTILSSYPTTIRL